MKLLSSAFCLLALVSCRPEAGGVLVFAAASLTDAFTEIETAFEAAQGDDVVSSFAGSASLREQILEGAPADVFAPADPWHLEVLAGTDEIAYGPFELARNRMQIAVPTGNPAGVRGLRDFADPDRFIGLCAEDVPCGVLARRVLEKAGIDAAPDTLEPDVRALVTKIEAGELDAGIVYHTDVLAARGKVEGIDIPEEVNAEAVYPIAVMKHAPHPAGARAFVDFVLSEAGQAILADAGFLPPRSEP